VLGIVDESTIFVNGRTSYMFPRSIVKKKVLTELNEIKEKFNSLRNQAKKFADYAKDKNIEYNVIMSTGTAGIKICIKKTESLNFSLVFD
jgi:hypothetical protein